MRIFGDRIITEKKRSGFEVLYGKRSFVVYNKTKVVVTNRIITEKKQSGFEVLYGKRSFVVYNKTKRTKVMEEKMRIDKFLKVSRIIKRRTVANEACDAGRVLVNDRVVKASYDVKVNDIIQIQFGQRTVKVQVLNLNETVKKENATEMYKDLS